MTEKPETLKIADLLQCKNPFEGVDQDQHIQIDAMLDMVFEIIDIKPFENDKGLGVYALIDLDGEDRYICTHSIALTGKLTNLKQYTDAGKRIAAHIGKRPSLNDRTRTVYYLY